MTIILNGQTIIQRSLSLVQHIYRRIYLKTRLLIHRVSLYYNSYKLVSVSVDSFAFGVLLYKCYAGQTIIDCSVYDAQRVLQNEKGIINSRHHFRIYLVDITDILIHR